MKNFAWVVVFGLALSLDASAAGKGGKKPAPAKPAPAPAPVSPPRGGGEQAAAQDGAPPPTRGPTRIDFDDRLIQGQTNKSGAVYLYDRKELKTKSMIKTRDSFREEIVGSLYDT